MECTLTLNLSTPFVSLVVDQAFVFVVNCGASDRLLNILFCHNKNCELINIGVNIDQ